MKFILGNLAHLVFTVFVTWGFFALASSLGLGFIAMAFLVERLITSKTFRVAVFGTSKKFFAFCRKEVNEAVSAAKTL